MQQAEAQPPAKSATLNEAEASDYLGISRAYLAAARLGKPRTSGPPYVRLGRSVRYLVSDLDAWLERKRVVPQGSEATETPAA